MITCKRCNCRFINQLICLSSKKKSTFVVILYVVSTCGVPPYFLTLFWGTHPLPTVSTRYPQLSLIFHRSQNSVFCWQKSKLNFTSLSENTGCFFSFYLIYEFRMTGTNNLSIISTFALLFAAIEVNPWIWAWRWT